MSRLIELKEGLEAILNEINEALEMGEDTYSHDEIAESACSDLENLIYENSL